VTSKDRLLTSAAWIVCIAAITCSVIGRNIGAAEANATPNAAAEAELARYEQESSSVRIEPARMGEQDGIAVVFTGTQSCSPERTIFTTMQIRKPPMRLDSS